MTFALQPKDFYHTGIVVPDLDAAMARLTALAGYRWITPLSYTLPFRTTAGVRDLTSTIVYSVQSPHLELVQEVPGTPWTAAPGNSVHHVGYFTDNLAQTARALESNGFTFEMTGEIPDSEFGMFAYYIDPFGTRVEIVDRGLFPDFAAFVESIAAPDPTEPDMVLTVLRFNFASPHGEPRTQSKLLSAALELTQWGESHGIATVSVDEHHATGHGWSCNPIMAAAMLLARTSTMIASVDCALGPLWNPVRLAEDIALVDNMSRGRLHTTVGLGYRTVEYDALGADFGQRGALMDDLLSQMLGVWSGAGAGICTGTWTRPHPPLYVGGGARATARRAARFGLPLSLADHLPDIAAYYRELCAESGIKPFILMPGPINRGMIYLHEDPERAWAQLGEHILWEAVTYGEWSTDQRSLMHLPGVRTLDEVKESGRYRFLTPDELIAEIRDTDDYGPLVLHPLVGGMPVDEAWKSVQLLTDTVLPALS